MAETAIGGPAAIPDRRYDLVIFGGICCDIIMSGLAGFPEVGQELYASRLKITVGGSFNVAAAATRLNLLTGLPCILGSDILSDFVRRTAAAESMDTGLYINVPEPYELLTVVFNFGYDRAFVSYAANHRNNELQAHFRTIAGKVRSGSCLFSMSGNPGQAVLMRQMAAGGSQVILDCHWDEEILLSAALREQITCSDYFVPSLVEARKITGEQAIEKVLAELSGLCRNVIIKMGPEGAAALIDGRIRQFSAYNLGEVVDTTGAGDNFVAGFCYGLKQQAPLEQCIRYGQICGSSSVLAAGGFTASLSEQKLLELAARLP